MTDKTRIIDALGEPKLLLPALANEALAAHDRAKFHFTLLQMAQGCLLTVSTAVTVPLLLPTSAPGEVGDPFSAAGVAAGVTGSARSMRHHLAQLNVARMEAPLDHPYELPNGHGPT